ncbi:MAG: sulfatase-like hydrolase/transferase, partial [Acetatifactor sp.]|nr:sulfatase-like hydrolase/transferase [Acetatifactor sp.]
FPGNLSNGKAEQAVRYYLGALTGVDENFGRILRAIEDKGIYDDTIVIFTSDHGDLMGSHNMTGKGPWYRDSFNIPFIVRYPGRIAPSNPKTVMGAVDVMPTILSLAGLKSQIPAVAEGHDRSGCMLTGAEDEEADALYFCFGRYRARGLKTGKYTFVSLQNYADDEMTVLYDDENDYYQLEDISEKEPETAALLRERLEKRLEEIGDNWRD